MLRYEFAIRVNIMPGKKEMREKVMGFNVPYEMLSFVSKGAETLSWFKSILENLRRVLSGEQENYEGWGTDEFTWIDSYREKSVISYTMFEFKDDQMVFEVTELPTEWLIRPLEDWIEFLEKPDDGFDKQIFGVPVPNVYPDKEVFEALREIDFGKKYSTLVEKYRDSTGAHLVNDQKRLFWLIKPWGQQFDFKHEGYSYWFEETHGNFSFQLRFDIKQKVVVATLQIKYMKTVISPGNGDLALLNRIVSKNDSLSDPCYSTYEDVMNIVRVTLNIYKEFRRIFLARVKQMI